MLLQGIRWWQCIAACQCQQDDGGARPPGCQLKARRSRLQLKEPVQAQHAELAVHGRLLFSPKRHTHRAPDSLHVETCLMPPALRKIVPACRTPVPGLLPQHGLHSLQISRVPDLLGTICKLVQSPICLHLLAQHASSPVSATCLQHPCNIPGALELPGASSAAHAEHEAQ